MIVGFIGLGTMGGPMARNLLAKGHRLIVSDVQPAAVRALTEAGATTAATPKEVAAASEIVITMLPDSPDVERVALGLDGIVEGISAGAVYIDMSTIDPATTRKVGAAIAAKGASMIDSPVGKTADHAVAGTLTLMVGGPAEVVARCREVLGCMGTDFFHCGELGAGQTMKLLNNLLATAVGEASIEALVAGTKSGLTLDTMMNVFRTTMAWNNQLAIAMPKRPLVGDFKPGFMMKLAHKDCRLALQMVDALGIAAPVGRAALASLEEGIGRGLQDDDVGALLKLREESAGVEVRLRTRPSMNGEANPTPVIAES
jgi:3-hydroxyisobutyrate dehydrogenase-like beta-hydroxyacid dehydrogenase